MRIICTILITTVLTDVALAEVLVREDFEEEGLRPSSVSITGLQKEQNYDLIDWIGHLRVTLPASRLANPARINAVMKSYVPYGESPPVVGWGDHEVIIELRRARFSI